MLVLGFHFRLSPGYGDPEKLALADQLLTSVLCDVVFRSACEET